MALRDAILVMLLDGESSGYDLAKSFSSSVANFWTATPQQLYRELDKMESDGLLSARVVEQQRRPNKRLFSLTRKGEDAIAEFSEHPPKPTAIRDDLLVQLQGLEWGNATAVAQAVRDRLAQAQTKLAGYQKARQHLLAGRTEADFLATSRRVGPYLTLDRGIAFERGNIRWARRVLEALSERESRTGDPGRVGQMIE